MKEDIAVKNLIEIKKVFEDNDIEFFLNAGTLLGAIREGRIFEWDHDIDLAILDNFGRVISVIPELKKRGFDVYWFKARVDEKTYPGVIRFTRYDCPIDVRKLHRGSKKYVYSMPSWPSSQYPRLLKIIFCIPIFLFSNTLYVNSRKWFPFDMFWNRISSLFSYLPLKLRNNISNFLWRIVQKGDPRYSVFMPPKKHFDKLDTTKFYGVKFKIPSDVEGYLELRYGMDWRTPKRKWSVTEEDDSFVILKKNEIKSKFPK